MTKTVTSGSQDKRPTMAEWPIRIWCMEEFPNEFKEYAMKWMTKDFSEYNFVFAPKRRTAENSFAYVFGYDDDTILYLKNCDGEIEQTTLSCSQIMCIITRRELLNAEIRIIYNENMEEKVLEFPYVPSTYYLYDPFLNWMLGLSKDFTPAIAERAHPRPETLYHESLTMYNYSLSAYRLGNGFSDYVYRFQKHRKKWMPWKVSLEEWLDVNMERGTFKIHSLGYLTECSYELR